MREDYTVFDLRVLRSLTEDVDSIRTYGLEEPFVHFSVFIFVFTFSAGDDWAALFARCRIGAWTLKVPL